MAENPNSLAAKPGIVLLGEDQAGDMRILRTWLQNHDSKQMSLSTFRAVHANINEFIRLYSPDTIGTERKKSGTVEGGGTWEFRYNEAGTAAELIFDGVDQDNLYYPDLGQKQVAQRIQKVLSPERSSLLKKAKLSQGNLENATEGEIRSAFLDARQDPIGQDLIVKGLLKKEAVSAAFMMDLLEHVVSPEAGRGLVKKLAEAGAFRTLHDPALKKYYTAVILEPLSEYFAPLYMHEEISDLQKELQKRQPNMPIVSWTMARCLATKMPLTEFEQYVLEHPQFFGSDHQRMMILRTVLTNA